MTSSQISSLTTSDLHKKFAFSFRMRCDPCIVRRWRKTKPGNLKQTVLEETIRTKATQGEVNHKFRSYLHSPLNKAYYDISIYHSRRLLNRTKTSFHHSRPQPFSSDTKLIPRDSLLFVCFFFF